MDNVNHLLNFNTLLDKLRYHLDKSGVFNDMIATVNREIPFSIFRKAAREKISINEWLKTVEDSPSQHTVVSTVRLSYEGIKTYFAYEANNFLMNYHDAKIKVLEYNEVRAIEELTDLAFDVVFEIDDETIAIEIKVTQSKTGFLGTTHSTSKVDDYLFIALDVDRDLIVEEGGEYIKGVALEMRCIVDKSSWKGKPSESSSRTTFTFKANEEFLWGGMENGKFKYKIINYE